MQPEKHVFEFPGDQNWGGDSRLNGDLSNALNPELEKVEKTFLGSISKKVNLEDVEEFYSFFEEEYNGNGILKNDKFFKDYKKDIHLYTVDGNPSIDFVAKYHWSIDFLQGEGENPSVEISLNGVIPSQEKIKVYRRLIDIVSKWEKSRKEG